MSKSLDQDIMLKLRMRRVLFTQGYWTPIEVELSHYDNLGTTLKRRSLTDLDVLGVKYDTLFTPHRVVCDCKSGKNVQDVSRIFWLKGVTDYFGADTGYFVRPRIEGHARAIAPKMKLRTIDDRELTELETTLNVNSLPLPVADLETQSRYEQLWGIVPPKTGEGLTEDQMALKSGYSHLSYAYWYTERHRSLFTLISVFEKVARYFDPKAGERLSLLAHVATERFALCLLDIVNHIHTLGTSDVPHTIRLYLYGGAVALREKERFFELIRRATNSTEQLDAPWMGDIIELIGRMLRNPVGASDVLRHLMSASIWCGLLGNKEMPEIRGIESLPSIVMAKDIVLAFTNITKIPRDCFRWLATA